MRSCLITGRERRRTANWWLSANGPPWPVSANYDRHGPWLLCMNQKTISDISDEVKIAWENTQQMLQILLTGYGIGLPKNSPLTPQVNRWMLQYQHNGHTFFLLPIIINLAKFSRNRRPISQFQVIWSVCRTFGWPVRALRTGMDKLTLCLSASKTSCLRSSFLLPESWIFWSVFS